MKKTFLALFIVAFICSCAPTKKMPVVVSGNNYFDPNSPTMHVDFPFPVRFVENNTEVANHQRATNTFLWSAKEGVNVKVSKVDIMANSPHFYTGVDIQNNAIYKQQNGRKGCSVYFHKNKNKNFLVGNIIENITRSSRTNVLFFKDIGSYSIPTTWKTNNSDTIETFVEYVKNICNQDLHVKKDSISNSENPLSPPSQKTINEGVERFDKGLSAYNSKDYAIAFASWLLLAEAGHPESAFRIAGMYDSSQGVEQDYEQAANWYLTAAEYGHGEAQCKVANHYAKGLGVPRNPSEAYKWYWLCAGNKSNNLDSKREGGKVMGEYLSTGVLSYGQVNYLQNIAKDWKPYEPALTF